MTQSNPYIVKDRDGDACTIRQFVTGRPLAQSEIVPDSHGIYPVNPLGFMMRGDCSDDGACETLQQVNPTTGFVPEKVYRDDGHGELKPADCAQLYSESYVIDGKYTVYTGKCIAFHVLSLTRVVDNRFSVTVDGNVNEHEVQSFRFRNVTTDDYTNTGLVGVEFTAHSIVSDGERTVLTLSPSSGDTEVVFDGIVGEGKLDMCVQSDRQFLAVRDTAYPGMWALYRFGYTEYDSFRRLCTYETTESGENSDSAPNCYGSNGYSDSEVAGFVNGKLSGLYNYGVHPMGEVNNLSGAGALVNWFVSCGQVDASGGVGRNSVLVQGFGLGTGYTGMCIPYNKDLDYVDPDTGKVRHWLTFGYSTKYDAWVSDIGKNALPLDWPFSNYSEYATANHENNITLCRHGIDMGGENVGALERDSHEECKRCDHTGMIPDPANPGTMMECPDCSGTGFSNTPTRILMDRIHVCLYNDFIPANGDNYHTDGTTVLKKTFINLATPLETEDGESFEITVSMPNVHLDDAWGDGTDNLKNLSAYYAYVSQPRVYVVSGTWDFSGTRTNFELQQDRRTVNLDSPFVDGAGNPLASTEDSPLKVRTTLRFSTYGKYIQVVGTLSLDGMSISLDDKVTGIPLAVTRGVACGASYVRENNTTLPSDTRVGLNNVRRADGALGLDYGNVPDGLEEFNRFYTVDDSSADRHRVLNMKDGRQVVATVYPTVTNTFPWRLTNRRKMKYLDRLMTGEADRGTESLFSAVADMNTRILARTEFERLVHPDQISGDLYPLDLTVSRSDLRSVYATTPDAVSVIGALLKLSSDADKTADGCQPVRQAIRAARNLASDFRMARLKTGAFDVASLKMKTDATGVSSADWDYGTLIDTKADANDYEVEAIRTRLRHLPKYLAGAGSSEQGEPVSEYLHAYPYSDQQYGYYSGNPYHYGEIDTTESIGDIQCDCVNCTEGRVYSINSVVEAVTHKDWFNTPSKYEDLLRSAELAAIDLSELTGSTSGDFYKPQGMRMDCPWLEPMDAFTKLVSPDNVPVPTFDEWYYAIIGDNASQMPFASGDAFGYYAAVNGWNDLPLVIATTLPYEGSLAEFLKTYVAGYGASLAVRNWDGSRIKMGSDDINSVVAHVRKKWYDVDCDDASRGRYVADAFLVDSGTASSTDYNLNRLEFSSVSDAMSMDCSVPPYTRNFRERFPFASSTETGVDSYIRVFMKFTFSADAGRWYCTDYRQAPVSYLTPLYGAKALEEKLDGERIWVSPSCGTPSWRDVTEHLYSEYRPMDINLALVDTVMGSGARRLALPQVPVEHGGLGLNAPTSKSGEHAIMCSTDTQVFTPTPGQENKWIPGFELGGFTQPGKYRLTLDMMWFGAGDMMPQDFDLRFQGQAWSTATEEWVWPNSGNLPNPLSAALNGSVRPRDVVTGESSGSYRYDVEVTVSQDWISAYGKVRLGMRADYAPTTGFTVIFSRLEVTPVMGSVALTGDMPNANFWNVRTHLRPATGASPACFIPSYKVIGRVKEYGDSGGIMADSVLWGQYDYPSKGNIEYHLPDTVVPDADLMTRRLIYAEPNSLEQGVMDTGDIQVGTNENQVLSASYGRDSE